MKVTLTVNGEQHEATIWPGESLLAMLRDRLGLPEEQVEADRVDIVARGADVVAQHDGLLQQGVETVADAV